MVDEAYGENGEGKIKLQLGEYRGIRRREECHRKGSRMQPE